MQITHNNNGNSFLLVVVPEDAADFFVHRRLLEKQHVGWSLPQRQSYYLPSGNWQIIGKGGDLSEAQWREIVEQGCTSIQVYRQPGNLEGWTEKQTQMGKAWVKITRVFYKKYDAKQKPRSFGWIGEVDTATESGLSLLRAHNLEKETTLILKQIK